MEFTTCEEYVLAELEDAHEAIDALQRQRDQLETENQLLMERLEAKPSATERIAAAEGRKLLFKKCAATYKDVMDEGAPVPFKDWCIGCTSSYSLPKGLSRTGFVEHFEPEFLEAYNEAIAEASEE